MLKICFCVVLLITKKNGSLFRKNQPTVNYKLKFILDKKREILMCNCRKFVDRICRYQTESRKSRKKMNSH